MKILSRNVFLFAFLILNLQANEALYIKYADKSINSSSLVERQGLKYQVNTNTPFSGRFVTYEDEYGFCAIEAGSYKRGLLHGPFEGYEGCGTLFSFKTGYKNGLEHGKYIEFMEGFPSMEGNRVDGVDEGEWIGYEYGQVSWKENVKNGVTLTLTSFSYYDNGQIASKEAINVCDNIYRILNNEPIQQLPPQKLINLQTIGSFNLVGTIYKPDGRLRTSFTGGFLSKKVIKKKIAFHQKQNEMKMNITKENTHL